MARKGLNLIPEALVDIAGLLTADPRNLQARAELAALVELQSRTGRRPLEPEQIPVIKSPHAYGSSSKASRRNTADPHQLSLPFFFKLDADEKPGVSAIDPGVVVSACMTCKVAKDKKELKTCRKVRAFTISEAQCRRANYCNVQCQ